MPAEPQILQTFDEPPARVEKKGLKIFAIASGAMPLPVSMRLRHTVGDRASVGAWAALPPGSGAEQSGSRAAWIVGHGHFAPAFVDRASARLAAVVVSPVHASGRLGGRRSDGGNGIGGA